MPSARAISLARTVMVRAFCVVLALGAATAPRPATAQTVPDSAAQIDLSFAPVARAAAPAVVNIYATRMVADRRSPFAGDPFFGELFREFGPSPPTRAQNALGSGVIVSPDGLVVSNEHVVGDATEIRVVLNDRREFDAQVVLTDTDSDLAVLQLHDAPKLPALALADSDAAQVGDLVLAIGNPFGVGQTVSSGIVSGLARSGVAVGSGRGYFLQTDAPINPGNSGGALVDTAGRLLGVNTAILTRSGGSNGIGFAVPANLVAQVVAQARDGRDRFQRPWAGVTAQAVGPDLAAALGQDTPRGVVLSQLHARSPLAAAGLARGDVVLAVNGAPVNSAPELRYRFAALGPGAQATLRYRSDGGVGRAQVALAPPPDTPPRARRRIDGRVALQGLEVVRINPAVIAERELALDADGVLVTGAQGLARRVGLRPGDILRAINGTTVTATDDVVRLARAQTRDWVVTLDRDGRRLSLRFRL